MRSRGWQVCFPPQCRCCSDHAQITLSSHSAHSQSSSVFFKVRSYLMPETCWHFVHFEFLILLVPVCHKLFEPNDHVTLQCCSDVRDCGVHDSFALSNRSRTSRLYCSQTLHFTPPVNVRQFRYFLAVRAEGRQEEANICDAPDRPHGSSGFPYKADVQRPGKPGAGRAVAS